MSVKDKNKQLEAEAIFQNTTIQITTSGKRHLGAALGSDEFKSEYMSDKVNEWCNKMKKLVEIAKCQPHAAYTAYIHGEQHKYTYFLRTIANISELLIPLDSIIRNEFIPALFGTSISPNQRELLALPIKEGGLGLRTWCKVADISYNTSKIFTKPLQEQIKNQNIDLPSNQDIVIARVEATTALKQHEKNNKTIITESQDTGMK